MKMQKKFYWLGGGSMPGAFHVKLLDKKINIEKLVNASFTPTEPLKFRQYLGAPSPKDLIGTGFPSIKLISEQIVKELKKVKATGWKTFPVKVYDKKGNKVKNYYGLAVTGRSGPIINSLSRKKRVPPRIPGGKTYEVYIGLFFDIITWDGSDIFIPKGSNTLFVTEKVKIAIESRSFENIYFEPISEVENFDVKYNKQV